ncbi:MAG: hypothetical protein K8S99_15215 [Planctomycetes bacterium]|nr:hypothetical protein [Planctomycetota bacterium]
MTATATPPAALSNYRFKPGTNADGLPVIPMTDEQKYIFDLKGWLLLPSLFTEEELGPIREHMLKLLHDHNALPIHHRHQLAGPGEVIADHPAIVGVLNEVVSEQSLATDDCYGFRYDHTYTQYRKRGDDRFGPHGGGGYFNFVGNSHTYQMLPGRVNAGLVRVVLELNPVRYGKGGTLLLSGSHKTAFPRPESISKRDSKYWETYECPGGSALVFTEALCHTGTLWENADNDRLALFTCYNTVASRWGGTPNGFPGREVIGGMKPKRQTLYRGVWHGMPPGKNINTYVDDTNLSM